MGYSFNFSNNYYFHVKSKCVCLKVAFYFLLQRSVAYIYKTLPIPKLQLILQFVLIVHFLAFSALKAPSKIKKVQRAKYVQFSRKINFSETVSVVSAKKKTYRRHKFTNECNCIFKNRHVFCLPLAALHLTECTYFRRVKQSNSIFLMSRNLSQHQDLTLTAHLEARL